VNWDQLRTILWLRWRLTRNMWIRGKGLGAILAAMLVIGACMLGTASFVGAVIGGIFGLRDASAFAVWAVWCVATALFLFLWMIGLIQELQRSEIIDLQRLMHLPVLLGQIFVINYLASHLAFSVILVVPALMGLAIGLTIARGPAMLLLVPLSLGMVFAVSAWTYCLRGWLATLMSNPRRRRNVVMVIVFCFILVGQAPNLYFNAFRHNVRLKTPQKDVFADFRSVQRFVPPLWLPLGAEGLIDGNALPALLGTLGSVVIGAIGLWRAYRGTVRFYRGDSGGKVPARIAPNRAPVAAATPARKGGRFLELRLPAVPEQAAALALATFRSMLRAPEVKMAWGASIIVPLVVAGSLLIRHSLQIPAPAKPFIATGTVVFSVFMLVQFFSNQFGLDRDGFRALILSPVNRRLILLGKNLACLPVGFGFGLTLLILTSIRLQLPPLLVVAALLQQTALLMLACLVGNLLSILVPFRIQPGSMKPTKLPALAMLLLVLCHLLFPVAMAPVFLPAVMELLWHMAGWPKAVPVNFILSLLLAAVMAFVYWQTLAPLGRLLQRRETKILGKVTVEVE